MTYLDDLTSTDNIISRMEHRHGANWTGKVKEPAPVTQLDHDMILFKKILEAKEVAKNARRKHDDINDDLREEGFLDTTYHPLSAKQRVRQEALFQEYKERQLEYKRLRASMSGRQAIRFEEFKQDSKALESEGTGWFVLLVIVGLTAIVSFSIILTSLLSRFSSDEFEIGFAPYVVFLISLVLTGFSVSRLAALTEGAEAAFNAKWYPKA